MNENQFWELDRVERNMNLGPEESLRDVWRTLAIKDALGKEPVTDSNRIIKTLKKTAAPGLKGEERLFTEAFKLISGMSGREIVDYVGHILFGTRCWADVSSPLFSLMFKNLPGSGSVFVHDCEKYGTELYDLIEANRGLRFFLATKDDALREIYSRVYSELGAEFISPEIYSDSFTNRKFDLIVSFPIMGGRELDDAGDFISREYSLIAAQNLLYHLTPSGKLVILLPGKVGFAGRDVETFRRYIAGNYKLQEIASLPPKTFYPHMSISTYLLTIGQGETDAVNVIKYALIQANGIDSFMGESRLIFSDELEELGNWNVDMAFAATDETLLHYQDSLVKKEKLKDVADVFRGKAVTEKADGGNVAVINISNITDTGITYESLDTIVAEERKIGRYLLEDGDVLVTTKGYAVKIAVYERQEKMTIASSNLCVIRPNTRLMNGTYLKLFLESETGKLLIKALQRGTAIININSQDLCEIEVPVPPLDEQLEIASEYNAGLDLYKRTLDAAEKAWAAVKSDVMGKLY